MEKTPKKKSKTDNTKPVHVKISTPDPIPVDLKGTSSISLKRAVSGGTEINVKVYDSDPDKARISASRLFKKLKKEFPG